MRPPTPFAALLRAEFSPTKRRYRRAIRSGAACVVALGICIAVQTPWAALGGAYPLFLLSPATTCTWRNMIVRLTAIVVACAAAVPVVGVLVDIPWALIPAGIFIAATVTYLTPVTRDVMVWKASMTGVATIMVEGTFSADAIGSAALGSVVGLSIAVIVSTVFARVVWPEDPAQVLTQQLGESFRGCRVRLDNALTEFANTSTDAGPPEAPVSIGLGDNIRALMQAGHAPAPTRERARRNTLVTGAQRVLFSVVAVEELTATRLRPALRESVAAPLDALRAALSRSIDAYAQLSEPEVGGAEEPWPDFSELLADLQDAWTAAQVTNQPVNDGDVWRRQNFAALLTTLAELTSQLRVPPQERIADATSALPVNDARAHAIAPGLDRAALALAVKGGVAMMLAYVVVAASGHKSFLPATWLAVMIVEPHYGGTIRRAVHALAGASVGGVLAIVVVMTVIPNTTGPFFYLVAALAVTVVAAYGGLAGPRLSFAFLQMGLAYMFCIAMLAPSPDVTAPLSRVMGILIGVSATYLVFRFVERDYAENHALRLLNDILRPLPGLVPQPGQPCATRAGVLKLERERVIQIQSFLQIIEEARFEHPRYGVDIDAALRVSDLARRVAVEVSAVGLTRAEFSFRASSDALGAALREAQNATREWLAGICRILEVTERLGQPNSRRRRRGRPAIEAAAGQPHPPLRRLIDRVQHEYDATYFRRAEWTQTEREQLASQVVHLRRLGAVLPELRNAVTQTCLPGETSR